MSVTRRSSQPHNVHSHAPHHGERPLPATEAPLPKKPRGPRRTAVLIRVAAVVVLLVAVAAYVGRAHWLPALDKLVTREKLQPGDAPAAAGEAHAAHESAAETANLKLSEQGRRNVGLTLVPIELRDFARTVQVPGIVAERPGRTEIVVSAPMTGIVTRVLPIRGEAVRPGQPLFELRLTHEDVVEKQAELLRLLGELDVVQREVARLQKVTANGAIAGKTLLERQYEQEKIEANMRAAKQALTLHGLSSAQVEQIVTGRELLQQLTVAAPAVEDCEGCTDHEEYLQVAEVTIKPGEQVVAGTPLATLTDHCELYIEGRAFEEDAEALNRAAQAQTPVTATVEANGADKRAIAGLKILYVENEVQRSSRALRFYMSLTNELVRNDQTSAGHRFIAWRYKPGQRVEVLVPVEQWKERIVLPVEALVQDGAEWYVYQQSGRTFQRREVHVEYRDPRWAVVANDGTLFPGDLVAARGAYQIHLALKNKSGGGVDPHAGHNH